MLPTLRDVWHCLQYMPYTAEHAREHSIGAGDPTETVTNRSYKGFTETTFNIGDMQLVIDTKKQMNDNQKRQYHLYASDPISQRMPCHPAATG